MHFNNIFSTLALLSLSAAAAVSEPKVLSLPLNRALKPTNYSEPIHKGGLNKRANNVNAALANQQYYYTTDIEIGTPGQKISVLVDTGSSDLWVSKDVFNPKKSSTYKSSTTPFQIGYGDGSYASGTFVTDNISLYGATIKQANFAYATTEHFNGSPVYIFGVGLPTGEGAAKEYDNLPVQLKKQGFTESNSYSLWLNDWTDQEGAILFGGVDHARYEGTLGKVPVVSVIEQDENGYPTRPSQLTRLTVNLNSIGVSKDGKSGTIVSGAAAPVLLDSGTTFGLLPDDWVSAIASSLGAEYDDDVGTYVTTKSNGGTLDLDFSGVKINVPLDSFIRPVDLNDGTTYQKNGQDAYQLAVQGTGSSGVDITTGTIYILGDGFLSGAYVAFDLDNKVIGLANAKLGNIGDSNIEVIGASGIPGTKAPGYASATSSNNHYSLHTPTGIF